MILPKYIILIIFIFLGVSLSGCTSGQDVTPVIKAIPEVQQFLKEHPDAKITVTYWSKDDVAKLEQGISKQCDRPITPVAMYKATVSEGDIKSIMWLDAESKTVLCSTIEGKGETPISTPIQTPTPAATPAITSPSLTTSTPVITPIPTAVPTPGPESLELKNGYRLSLAKVEGIIETRLTDGTVMYSKSENNASILLLLLRDGKMVNEQTVSEGTGFSLYDGEMVVKANFHALFLGEINCMVNLDSLVQYDKDTEVFTRDTVTLTVPYPSAVPAATYTPLPTPTPTATPVPTATPEPTALPYNKILTAGETWALGGGYALTVNSIDVNSTPKVIWFILSKDGLKLDDKVISEGYTYNYNGIFSTKAAYIYQINGTYLTGAVRFENSSLIL